MIDVSNLSFTYPGSDTPILHGLEFEIKEREILGFLGPSGAGKSTTQKILFGLLKDYSGTVRMLKTAHREVMDMVNGIKRSKGRIDWENLRW